MEVYGLLIVRFRCTHLARAVASKLYNFYLIEK